MNPSSDVDSPTMELRRRGNRGTITKVARVKDFGGTALAVPGPETHK